jgi:hypothetical protein
MSKKKIPHRVLQIKIELEHSHPPVWRRFLVRDDVLLIELHNTIQSVMGWWDSHLHLFTFGKKEFWNGGDETFGGTKKMDVEDSFFRDANSEDLKTFRYDYDFGDGWRHVLTIEKVLDPKKVLGEVPQCLEGANACPPENVGGSSGFEEFKKTMQKPKSTDFESKVEWHGSIFNADSFCVNLVNRELRHLQIFDWKEKPKARAGTLVNADPYE